MHSVFRKKDGGSKTSKTSTTTSSSSNPEWKQASHGLGFLASGSGRSRYQKLKQKLDANFPGYDLWYKDNGETMISKGTPPKDPQTQDTTRGGIRFDPQSANTGSNWNILDSLAEKETDKGDESYKSIF